jgi:1,2-diacylglycerol 3-alpha-glucosyltransferase
MALGARQSISVVFPAYNEEENIGITVQQALDCLESIFQDWEVIVVDDGSRDKTSEVINELAKKEARLTIVRHPGNQGYGAALRSGIQKARKELIFFCDSDLQFRLNELLFLLIWIEQYDIVIGYRVKREDPWYRKLFALGWKILVRLLLGLKIRDIDCAFKLFRSAVFKEISIDAVGAMVNTDILVQAVRMGFKIKEVPVTHFPRPNGKQTGARLRVIFKAFRELFGLRRKLRCINHIVIPYDRRQGPNGFSFTEQRFEERRKVMLPINFPDRRRRLIALPRTQLPSSFSSKIQSRDAEDKNKPLKVAMVIASPFPANHGTPAGIREMAEAIASRNHQVHVVTYHFGEGIPPKDVQIHRIVNLGFRQEVVVGPSFEKPILDVFLLIKLIRVIATQKIDLIHAHNYEGGLIGYLAKIMTGRPLIYNAVNTMIDELPTYDFFRPKALAVWLAKFLDYWVPRMADKIISISDDLARFLVARGIKPERIEVIPLGINRAHFNGKNGSVIRHQYRLGQRPVVMYTGILDRFQRVDYLLKAMRIVLGEIGNARLLIVANVAKEQDITDCWTMIRELNLQEHVDIIANRPFEEIPLFLAAADVTVLCRPNCPGFPVKLLNYMAAGKAIVLFEGSAKGLQPLKHAVVIKDHDWQALGQGVVTVLKDPVFGQTLGRSAQQWANENLSWPNLAEKIEEIYFELLERQPDGTQVA